MMISQPEPQPVKVFPAIGSGEHARPIFWELVATRPGATLRQRFCTREIADLTAATLKLLGWEEVRLRYLG
jgi:hypothetical protein